MDNKSWWRDQFIKLRNLTEVLITLILDALLIIFTWYIRKLIICIIGVDLSTIEINDELMSWVIRLCDFGTIFALVLYVFLDIFRHLLKTYKDIKSNINVCFSGGKKVKN